MSYRVQVQRTVPRHGIIAILPRVLPTLRLVWPEYEMRIFSISPTAVMPSKALILLSNHTKAAKPKT